MSIEIRFSILKDPWSFATHFAGFLLAIAGLVMLLVWSDGAAEVTGMAIYGGSLVALFGASSLYHFLDLGHRGNAVLRRLDHAAIFLLIAGSYLPPLIHLLDGAWRIAMISVVGGLGAAGILFKLVWFRAPDWLSTALYLGLGWVVLVPAYRILPQLGGADLAWLVTGGLVYTLGAVVYLLERPDPFPDVFGHHEVWHILVLIGAAAHWVFAARLADQAYPPF